MSAHTPGPWLREDTTVYVLDEGNCNRWWVGVQTSGRCSTEEREANACLIAAAPELLKSLKDCLDSLEYLERHFPHLVGHGVRAARAIRAREVIAKATGVLK